MITSRKVYWFTLVFIVMNTSLARTEKFDDFLVSLDRHLPIDTSFMRLVLEKHNTRLAHPSILESWGLINRDAAASYHEILNTIILKPEYTTTYKQDDGQKKVRVKTYSELQQSEPVIWYVRLGTIFHELSHAEFAWLSRSTVAEDQALMQFLKIDFDDYLKEKHPQYSASERKIARSELFAYFRDEFMTRLITTIEEVFIENGYVKANRSCRNTAVFLKNLAEHPNINPAAFVTFRPNVDFRQDPLPTIFVRGKDATIDKNDPIYSKLQKLLWAQFVKHYAPATSKYEIIKWMNSKPQFVELIQSCRHGLAVLTDSVVKN
ncbi:MAG: hypothetical protein JNL11_00825 [Bdellovibrionaceae bacterium]|nr:hypothetical protein [Pseudobdellovibrionaceae bacterium]